jgi:DNA-binding HxlR family transcriptional regulator
MTKRSYKQQCALARALDMVGDRWTFLIIRELIIAPKRYKTLVENLKGMGTNLLANRLKELEQLKVIERAAIADSKLFVYQLSEFGRELEAPILAIIRWGFKLPVGDESEYLTKPEWDLVAMKAAFRPELAKDLDIRAQFTADELVFAVIIKQHKIAITLDEIDSPDVVIKASIGTLIQLDAGELSITEAKGKGLFKHQGELAKIVHLLGCFNMN